MTVAKPYHHIKFANLNKPNACKTVLRILLMPFFFIKFSCYCVYQGWKTVLKDCYRGSMDCED